MQTNDLVDFMNSATQEIENEYKRIQKRATEDPGTAGDQGEENWATLLRNWLPPAFQIVTKGRILSDKGIASPQVDVIILQPEYPKQLLDKKLYLAGGVFAVFECKVTLKSQHIEDSIRNSIEVKGHLVKEEGSPYKELQSSILYGLLAHSHIWNGENSTPIDNIEKKLLESDKNYITHPFQTPDLICIADLATWSTTKLTFIGPKQIPNWASMSSIYGPKGSATSAYVCHSKESQNQSEHFTPIGALLTSLLNKLAWVYPNLRTFARYFELTDVQGSGGGPMRIWDSSIYSDKIRKKVELGQLSNGKFWDEWSIGFH
jgi:hypothetical protein